MTLDTTPLIELDSSRREIIFSTQQTQSYRTSRVDGLEVHPGALAGGAVLQDRAVRRVVMMIYSIPF